MLMPVPAKRRWHLAALVLVLLASGAWFLNRRTPSLPQAGRQEYAPAESCRTCHAAIYTTYQRVGMSRSFYEPTPETVGTDLSGSRYHHVPSGRLYEMTWRDGKLSQRRYQLDRQGREMNSFEQQVHFVIGSGNHARTFLHQSANGEITELPLSWYADGPKWGMSPGFDKPRHFDFSRRIDHGCMFCHNAYPAVDPAVARFGFAASFPSSLPNGIDCQRCHGPAAEHVALAGSGKAAPAAVRDAVVNPARLAPELQMDLCMQCHLEITSAPLPQGTRRFGRDVYSYRPGEPLGDYMVYFDHAPGTGHDDKFEIVGAAYRLRQSACFVKSSGRLTCVTCHNPHDVKRGMEAVAHNRQRCVSCHEHLPHASHPDPQGSDCAACHMPKRRTEDAVHVVMTDHFIQRRPPARNLLAPLREKDTGYRGDLVLYYPERLPEADRQAYLGIGLAAHGADRLRGIALMEQAIGGRKNAPPKLWVDLADAYMAEGRTNDAINAYQTALAGDPGLEKARYNLAQALERSGKTSEAQQQYERLTGARSGFAEAHYSLANLLSRAGQEDRALAEFQASLRARPAYVESRNNLALLHLTRGDQARARLELEEALKINPDSAEALSNLARVFATEGRHADALDVIRRAVELEPRDAGVRLNLGRLLHVTGNLREAMAEFERVVRANPDFAEAHLSLGIAYGESGRIDAAIREFQRVLELQPGHTDARRNLDIALEMAPNHR
jgi:tetratricopeptide (TPR) repeat protein